MSDDLLKNTFQVDISKEMKDSYLQYSMSVIVGRALPDVRDGLKPVHRRILYAMRDLGNAFDKPYKKSARVVGDVIGKYHPHGESAVYDSIVRMAQDFSMNHTLVDGQGNFGSVDGDTAAASRYTEIRMTALAGELLKDIEKETTGFEWNYDDTLLIPTVLPAQFPNLLVNGSAGIAVGMASNIPPHNLSEVIQTCKILLEKDLSLEELFAIIPGPDFPTGGIIVGQAGVLKAYKTGRGIFKIRAVSEIENFDGRDHIVIKEIPYQVNKSQLIENIASQVRDKTLEGISDIRDESSREGIRVVITLKKQENAQVILNHLYKQTKLQISYGVNLLALDSSGQPQTYSLKDVLLSFLSHRRDVITRRLVFDLNKAQERMHILEGLTKALDHLDEVISLIRESKEAAQARRALMERFEFSRRQTQAILDLKLQKLTGLEREKIVQEWKDLKLYIQKIKETLASSQAIDNIIRDELEVISKKFERPRKTKIEAADEDFEDIDLIAKEDIVVMISYDSNIKRVPLEEYRLQKRGGVGVKGGNLGVSGDWVWKTLCVNTHTILMVLTTRGKLYQLDAFRIPSGSRVSKRKSIRNLLSIESNENVRSVLPVADFLAPNQNLCLVTERGVFKKSDLSSFARRWQKGLQALNTREGDQLAEAIIANSNDDILIITQKGQGIRFSLDSIRLIKTRASIGVRGMRLNKGDKVKALHSVSKDQETLLLTVTQNGYGKKTLISEFRKIQRGGKGVVAHSLNNKTGEIAGSLVVHDDQQMLVVTNTGQSIRFEVSDVSQTGRSTQGVRLMRLKDGEHITDVTLVDDEKSEFIEQDS